jgi:hypothetical protein
VGAIPAINLDYAIAAHAVMIVSIGLPAVTVRFLVSHFALVTDEKTIRVSDMGTYVSTRDGALFIALFDRLTDGAVLRQILRPHA